MDLHSGNNRSVVRGISLYTLSNRRYFESFEHVAAVGDYRSLLRRLLPKAWSVKRAGLWYHASSSAATLPAGGFKLHVSATLEDAKRTLSKVVPICVAEQANFKLLRASNLLSLVNSKLFPRAAAHKFITIYPLTTAHFLRLAELLDAATKDFIGPYILSDRPVNASKVLFYRFGGFVPRPRLTIRGTQAQLIQTPAGTWVEDKRMPYFRLPAGVEDPFAAAPAPRPSAVILLNARYQVEKALAFSTCGGTYAATDVLTKQPVLIKEARPLTTLSHDPQWRFYAADAILREQKILERLAPLTCVPRHLGCFQEGGHSFSVQQMIAARPFRQYRAQEDVILAPFDGEQQRVERFCTAFREIGSNLLEAIRAIHRRGIVIGDVSPDNVLVDESRKIHLVDFESAWDRSWAPLPDKFATLWMTPGFRRVNGGMPRPVTYRDDWFAAGVLLSSMLLPVELLSALLPHARERFLKAIVSAARLPRWIPETVRSLCAARPRVALELLRGNSRVTVLPPMRSDAGGTDGPPLQAQVTDTLRGITNHILESCDTRRRDRLWPSDFKVFTTNPLSVAYGACGPLLLLQQSGIAIPDEVDRWLDAQPLTLDDYPPGLYLGLPGIAYTLWRLGHQDRAVHALSLAFESDLLYADCGMFHGAAGCGLASLQMYLWTKHKKFAEKALEIGTRVLADSVATDAGIAWKDSTRAEVLPGFAYGASGIALFLLYLSIVAQDDRFAVAAAKALEHEVASASVETPDRLPRWKASATRNVWSPYWLSGGCGIGSVLIRFYAALGEERYLQLARDVARANYSRFCVLPGQFEGLSGIGDFMLDMSMLAGDETCAAKARDIVESILLYRVSQGSEVAFPGRFLVRLSTDYGYGSSGVGMFLNRFLSGGRRALHDLEGIEFAADSPAAGRYTRAIARSRADETSTRPAAISATSCERSRLRKM